MIRAVVAAVPRNIERNFDASIIKATGVQERRIVQGEQDALTLGEAAARELIERVGWSVGDIAALIFVTQTSPVRMPGSAPILAGRLGIIAPAFDINLACSGYVYGLWLAHKIGGKVLLVAGDTVSEMVRPDDDSTQQLFGDCVTATAVETVKSAACDPVLRWTMGTNGLGWRHLKAAPYISMDGAEVASFALSTVPRLVEEVTMNSRVDWLLLHQANASLLNHLIRKCKLNPDKVPINMQVYGNTSSASIPLLMCSSTATASLKGRRNRVAMIGFGAGFSWAGVLMDIEPLVCAELLQI